jgi:hypothetical protein
LPVQETFTHDCMYNECGEMLGVIFLQKSGGTPFSVPFRSGWVFFLYYFNGS